MGFPLSEIKLLVDYFRGVGGHAHKDAYFAARPGLKREMVGAVFRDGFARAYAKRWDAVVRGGMKP